MLLDTPVDSLPNTSIITIRRLKSLGIKTYWNLLNYFPFRYEDYSLISKINLLQEGETVTVIGRIIDAKYEVTRTNLRIQKFIIEDETGRLELNWYNQPYLLQQLKKGLKIAAAGQIKRFGRKISMDPREYEIIDQKKDFSPLSLKHTGRLTPIYPEKKGLSSRTLREKIFYLLNLCFKTNQNNDTLKEFLPQEILTYNQLINEAEAYKNIHFPENHLLAEKARKRLAFDEMFFLQLSASLIKKEWEKETVGHQLKIDKTQIEALQHFIKNLPFELTNAQKKVWGEILYNLKKKEPMNRFLQGDVGSGKTVIAALACYVVYLNGLKSLFMAPTEILAKQHYHTLIKLFSPKENQLSVKYPTVTLITGSTKPKKEEIQSADIIIGTHALIQKNISFEKVGLVIIDEQHRFGVTQRAMLKKKGVNPHLLTMTATPIPRTVALILYGELDISVIDEMPKGRLPVKTFYIPKEKRDACYNWIKSQINNNQAQVFIICPLIDESKVETMKSLKAAIKEYQFLKEKIFPEFSVGLIHGKLKSKEKDEVMKNFKEKKYQILVATSVVEVGIDIPDATIMLIEGAERFGLAQLHQLRGRIGRSNKQSYCFLFSNEETSTIKKRLNFFASTQNGNLLAEKDLEIRGPGNIYGVEQHGIIQLKIASFSDFSLIEKTKKAVDYFLKKYKISEFEEMKKRVKEYQIEYISQD